MSYLSSALFLRRMNDGIREEEHVRVELSLKSR